MWSGAEKTGYLTAEQFMEFLNREQRDPRLNEILYPYYDVRKAQALIDVFEGQATTLPTNDTQLVQTNACTASKPSKWRSNHSSLFCCCAAIFGQNCMANKKNHVIVEEILTSISILAESDGEQIHFQPYVQFRRSLIDSPCYCKHLLFCFVYYL